MRERELNRKVYKRPRVRMQYGFSKLRRGAGLRPGLPNWYTIAACAPSYTTAIASAACLLFGDPRMARMLATGALISAPFTVYGVYCIRRIEGLEGRRSTLERIADDS